MAHVRNDILLTDAFEYAASHHRGDVRKGTQIPYLAHVLGVASFVLEYGGSDEQVAAAFLHDVPEDHGGKARLDEIKKKFGKKVAKIVRECSDSLTADPANKEKWSKRKKRYVKHLRTVRTPTRCWCPARTSSTTRGRRWRTLVRWGRGCGIGSTPAPRSRPGTTVPSRPCSALACARAGRRSWPASSAAVVNELELEAAKAR